MSEVVGKQPRRLRLGRWPALVILATAVALIVFSEVHIRKAAIGQPAPNFSLLDLNNQKVSLADFRGGVTVINFWASWCGPCREETPALQTFAERYGDKVTLLGVNYREQPDKIQAFVQEFGTTYTMLRDVDGKVADRYKMKALPESWFIDENGVARIYLIGTTNFEELRESYRSTTGQSLDGDRIPGDATVGYRIVDRNGFFLRDAGKAWQSTDNGTTWRPGQVNVAPGLNAAVASAVWAGKTGLAWVTGKGLYRTTDGGKAWHLVTGSTFNPALPNVALAMATNGRQVWAGTVQGLFTSNDGGLNWRQLPLKMVVNGIALHPTKPGQLLIASQRGIWFSQNGGTTAALLPQSPVRQFDDVAVMSLKGVQAIVAVAPNGDVYSTDGAGSWQLLNPGV